MCYSEKVEIQVRYLLSPQTKQTMNIFKFLLVAGVVFTSCTRTNNISYNAYRESAYAGTDTLDTVVAVGVSSYGHKYSSSYIMYKGINSNNEYSKRYHGSVSIKDTLVLLQHTYKNVKKIGYGHKDYQEFFRENEFLPLIRKK